MKEINFLSYMIRKFILNLNQVIMEEMSHSSLSRFYTSLTFLCNEILHLAISINGQDDTDLIGPIRLQHVRFNPLNCSFVYLKYESVG